MDILRGSVTATKVTLYIVLALIAAVFITVIHPRPTSAEGSLLGNVRCLVRTVLLTECKPVEVVVPAPTPAPAPAPVASAPSASSSGSQPAATSSSRTQNNRATVVTTEELAAPEPILVNVPIVEKPAVATSSYARMSGSEYLAYFNTYSKYAVAGAQQQAASSAPVARTGEGWRIIGIAWYWWGITVLLTAVIFASVRRNFLRKNPVLPEQ